MTTGSGLEAILGIARPVILGLPALAILRIVNNGPQARLVSARLNLMEGDVALRVTARDGAERRISGWQADTALERVSLPPGQQIVGALTLLETPEGPIFPEPGHYSIVADYHPSPQDGPLTSAPVAVEVLALRHEQDRLLASFLSDEQVRRSLLLGETDAPNARLGDLAAQFGDTYAGRLARLLVGESGDEVRPAGGVADALAVLALRTPFNTTGTRLAATLETRLQSADAANDPQTIRSLLKTDPIPATDIVAAGD